MPRQHRPTKPRRDLRALNIGIGVNRNDWAGLADPSKLDRAEDWLRAFWVDDSGEETHALIRLELTGSGELACTGLILGVHASAKAGPLRPITVRGLRRVPLQEILWQVGTEHRPALLDQWRMLGSIGANDRPKVRVGAKGWPPEHYKKLAAAYKRALKEAPEAPVKRLSEMWHTPEGKPTPESTIRRWLRVCREMDPPLLAQPRPGRPKKPPVSTRTRSKA